MDLELWYHSFKVQKSEIKIKYPRKSHQDYNIKSRSLILITKKTILNNKK